MDEHRNIIKIKCQFVDDMLTPIMVFNDNLDAIYFNKKGGSFFDKRKIHKIKSYIRENFLGKEIETVDLLGGSGVLRRIRLDGNDYYSFTVFSEECQKQIFGKVLNNISVDEKEFLDTLLKGFFHDLKNIFQVVKGSSQILLKSGDEKTRKISNRIYLSSEAAITLYKNFLAFYTLDKKRIKPINIVKEIKKVWDSFKKTVPEEIKLLEKGDFNLSVFVEITPIEIQQILTNLISNSIDALENGGEIELGFKLWRSDKDYFSLWVSDNGKGMDEKTLKNIFKPYYTTKKNGTGLGLYLVYTILKRRNGKISVFSEPLKGTTFKIYFETKKGKEIKKREEKFSYKGDVLVVDDNYMYNSLFSTVLKEKGFNPVSALTLKDALERLKDGEFEFAIIDIVLPDGSGVEIVKKIIKKGRRIPIIISTSLKDTGFVKELPNYGMIKFLRKPLLVKRVREFIDEIEKEIRRIERRGG